MIGQVWAGVPAVLYLWIFVLGGWLAWSSLRGLGFGFFERRIKMQTGFHACVSPRHLCQVSCYILILLWATSEAYGKVLENKCILSSCLELPHFKMAHSIFVLYWQRWNGHIPISLWRLSCDFVTSTFCWVQKERKHATKVHILDWESNLQPPQSESQHCNHWPKLPRATLP